MLFNAHTHFQNGSSEAIVNAEGLSDIPQFFSIGIHPWNASQTQLNLVNEKAQLPNCLAIGEIGLDKLNGPDLTIQTASFKSQIELSEKLELPVIIHCVKAWNELLKIKRVINPKQIWIYHGFAKANLTKEVLKEGLMISIGAEILKSETLQKALLSIPNDRLLLETDDQSIEIEEIYTQISKLKNIPLARLKKQIEDNFKRVFTKWEIG